MPLIHRRPNLAKKSAQEELERECFNLRVRGLDFWEIAKELNVSENTARKYFKRRMDRPSESIENFRKMEIARLDEMHRAVYPAAVRSGEEMVMTETGMIACKVGPDLKAVDSVLKIQERRANYLGLDAKYDKDGGAGTSITVTYQQVNNTTVVGNPEASAMPTAPRAIPAPNYIPPGMKMPTIDITVEPDDASTVRSNSAATSRRSDVNHLPSEKI